MASTIPSYSSDEDPDYQVGPEEETESEEEDEVEASDGASLVDIMEIDGVEFRDEGQGEESWSSDEDEDEDEDGASDGASLLDGSLPVDIMEILRNGEHGVEGGDEGQGEESSSSEEEVNGAEMGRGGGVGVCAGPSGFGNPNGEVLNCPICFEPWTPEGPHRVCCIPCGHVYGRSCLEKWVQRCGKNTGKCPICKRKFKQKEIINLYAPLIAVRNEELEKEVSTLREKNELLQFEIMVRFEEQNNKYEEQRIMHEQILKELEEQRQTHQQLQEQVLQLLRSCPPPPPSD